MTVEQFKERYPKYKDLEGDDLWNKMEYTLLAEQRKKPKRYQLRWLFYRGKVNLVFGKNNYTSNQMCDKCRKGVSNWLGFMNFGSDNKTVKICPHCSKEMDVIPNTNINHKVWNLYKKFEDAFWKILDFIHIVRDTTCKSRYEVFSDEHYFVKFEYYDPDWNYKGRTMKTRKWWEYIIIEKR